MSFIYTNSDAQSEPIMKSNLICRLFADRNSPGIGMDEWKLFSTPLAAIISVSHIINDLCFSTVDITLFQMIAVLEHEVVLTPEYRESLCDICRNKKKHLPV